MAAADVSSLVTCQWLKGKIDEGDSNVVILDVSWSSERDCEKEFQQRHIKGARYFNVMVGPHTELFPRSLPPQDVFQKAAGDAGVNDNSRVVLYSDSDNNGFFMSGRAWWTFTMYGAQNVSILNGGLKRWTSLGYPTTTDTPVVQPGNFTASYQSQYRLTFEKMSELVGSGATVLDSRPADKYNSGHIPGATSFPYTQLTDNTTGEMIDKENIKKALEQAGVDLQKPMTTYCNSGMSSSTLAFAYKLCGGTDVAVYHGGFTEWKGKAPADKIEKS